MSHPLTRALFTAMHDRRIGVRQLAKRAGVSERAIQNWRARQTSPTLESLDACFRALGLKLSAEPR